MNTKKSKRRTERGVLTAVTFSHLAQHFYVGFSVLYPAIMMTLNLNYTQLGIITGVTSIIAGFLQIFWSLLTRYASRRFLLGLGNIFISLGCFIMGSAHRFIDMISGNILSGSGQAAQHPIGTSIITRKFPGKGVSRALAIHYGLGYVGNIISPLLLSIISVAIGWRTATYFLAAIPLITGLTVLFYLKDEESASKNTQSNKKISLWKDIKSVFQNKSVMSIIAAQAFAVGGTGMGVIITYTPLFLKNALNIEILETSVIYSIAVLGGVVGTIMFGHLASKIGNLKMAATVIGTCSISILLLLFHNSYTLFLIPHLFIIGVTSFASGSLLQAYLASISTTRQRDIVIGLYFTVSSGISSIWTTLTGFLIDFYGSFNPAWIFRTILGISAFSLITWTLHQNQ